MNSQTKNLNLKSIRPHCRTRNLSLLCLNQQITTPPFYFYLSLTDGPWPFTKEINTGSGAHWVMAALDNK